MHGSAPNVFFEFFNVNDTLVDPDDVGILTGFIFRQSALLNLPDAFLDDVVQRPTRIRGKEIAKNFIGRSHPDLFKVERPAKKLEADHLALSAGERPSSAAERAGKTLNSRKA
jgi:hypothetical protein